MIGLICGLLLCYQPSPPAPEPRRAPAGLDPVNLVVNGSPVVVYGWTDGSGHRTWYWRDQTVRPSRPVSGTPGADDGWSDAEINGSPCRLWGWFTAAGEFRWRWDAQRHNYAGKPTGDGPPTAKPGPLEAGDLPGEDPRPAGDVPKSRPVKSGVVLPSGWEPNKDSITGALLLGVNSDSLARDGEKVTASDPQTKAEVEDVREYYAQAPDASSQAITKKLPPVISPNAWASIFGYDLPTALTRVGGVVLLAGAAYLIYGRFGASPA